MKQMIPIDVVRSMCVADDETVIVERSLIEGGRTVGKWRAEAQIVGREWVAPHEALAAATFAHFSPSTVSGWAYGASLPFFETLISTASERGFRGIYVPPFYTVFDSDDRKSFLSDNALKYANTVVIHQIRAFRSWVEGYPACTVDRRRDAGHSVILVNPHQRPAVVEIEVEGIAERRKYKIQPGMARRVDLGAFISDEVPVWSGQVFVFGSNRVNLFFASHSLRNPEEIVTIEHSEVYRGEHSWLPVLKQLLDAREKRKRAGATIIR